MTELWMRFKRRSTGPKGIMEGIMCWWRYHGRVKKGNIVEVWKKERKKEREKRKKIMLVHLFDERRRRSWNIKSMSTPYFPPIFWKPFLLYLALSFNPQMDSISNLTLHAFGFNAYGQISQQSLTKVKDTHRKVTRVLMATWESTFVLTSINPTRWTLSWYILTKLLHNSRSWFDRTMGVQ